MACLTGRGGRLQLVETEQVLLLDADFIPSTSMRAVARTGVPGLHMGQLLIVPPFQLTANASSNKTDHVAWERLHQSKLLLNKSSFIACFDSAASAYLSSPLPGSPSPPPQKTKSAPVCGGRNGLLLGPYARYLAANVNYKKWWTATEPYLAPNITDTEPYFIAHTREMLAFDERFVGYGGDKAEQFHRTMARNAQQLLVSPDFFIVHASLSAESVRLSPLHQHEETAATELTVQLGGGSHKVWDGGDKNVEHWKRSNSELLKELEACMHINTPPCKIHPVYICVCVPCFTGRGACVYYVGVCFAARGLGRQQVGRVDGGRFTTPRYQTSHACILQYCNTTRGMNV
jgi:hypothetical protein